MATIKSIEQGVSMYSYTQEFIEQPEFDADTIIRHIADKGIHKVELVGAQTFQQYPVPRKDEVDSILASCDKHDVQVFSYGGYCDLGRITGYKMTAEDILSDIHLDIMTARALGAHSLRTGSVGPQMLPRIAELADKYDLEIGVEIHAPHTPGDPETLEFMEVIDKYGITSAGLVPDFGMFIERPNEIGIKRYVEHGANLKLLEYIIANRHGGLDQDAMQEKIASMGGGEAEKMAVADWYGYLSFGPADLEGFKAMVPYTKYCHGKFYHLAEDLSEPTMPYADILRILHEGGFEGVLMTEYEGHCFYMLDADEQVNRHLAMGRQVLESL